MRTWALCLLVVGLAVSAVGCNDKEKLPSGSYPGTITEVNPGEREIYVETEDGHVLELYFTQETRLVKGDMPADFSALKEDARVRVAVELKDGKHVPTKVEILE